MNLTEFKALTFDCYGTLIDWESGMIAGLKPLLDQLQHDLSRNDILEAHARHESHQQHLTPTKKYAELLAVVYKRLAEEWRINVSWDDCLAYGHSIKNWPVFSDSVEALRYLKQHFRLYILSNVDNASFVHSERKLGVKFDGILTAEDIGSYKPNARNFEYLLDVLAGHGIKRSEILHTAESMFHDHAPANAVSLASCHIYRRSQQAGFGATMTPKEMPRYDFRFNSMQDLVAAHKALM